jgi:Tol biopolymer transport system component
MRHRILLALFLLSGIFAFDLSAQGSQVQFGKNRVQYHNDFDQWLMYESRNFVTYWYGEGRNIAESAILLAEKDYLQIENLLEHRINDKIELIVYTDVTDLKQSNIGSEEVFENTGGVTKIVDNKVFVYFNGDHHDLRKQIREGVAAVFLNTMLFGSNLQEIVQNAVMMNLPIWFKTGLVSFVGENWSTELDNQLRDIVMGELYEDFDAFAEDNPKLAGHSLWYFVYQNYGNATVSNLLYLTRINRSVENGFLYVLGGTYPAIIQSWEMFYRERYRKETVGMTGVDSLSGKVEFKNKKNLPVTQIKISPDGRRLAYVTNDIGKYKVYVHDLTTGKREVVHKDGFRNIFQTTDYNYPLLAWKPNNQELAIVFEKRDVVKYKVINFEDKSRNQLMEMPPQYQRVYSIDFLNNNNAVLSAAVRGYSDIFIFRESSRQTERVTRDFYDDLDVAVVNWGKKKGVLFSSNRTDLNLIPHKLDTVLPANNFDLYYYDLDEKNGKLVRVTNTPFANEKHPMSIDSAYFSYVSDESGIANRRIGYLKEVFVYNEKVILLNDKTEIVIPEDSVLTTLDTALVDSTWLQPVYEWKGFSFANTNYDRSILHQHSSSRSGKLVQLIRSNGKQEIWTRKLDTTSLKNINTTLFASKFQRVKVTEKPGERGKLDENTGVIEIRNEEPLELEKDIPLEKQDTGKIDIDNYLFQSEFDDIDEEPTTIIDMAEDEDSELKLKRLEEQILKPAAPKSTVEKFRPSRITPYRLKFRTDFFTTQLDNSLLFGGLDSYVADRQEYNYQVPGILLKTNFKDLFEDHEIEGGVRIPTTFNGSEYYLFYESKKKRLDHIFSVYRRAQRFTDSDEVNSPRSRDIIMLGQYGVRYPFDIFRSIRAFATLRQDQTVRLASDFNTLLAPTERVQRAGIKLEYVFDNTLDIALNLRHGTRYKIYAEVMKSFAFDLGNNASFSLNEGFLGIIGLDARHYQRLDKHSILALRLAGATSFGQERILFFMGGVDRWLFPSQNTDNLTPIPDENYAFQTLASNMRGFRTNIRNGSSFVLANAELRVPFFKYFSKRIKSNFLRNFQLIGFFDIGTAWEGLSPYGDDNPLNTRIIQNPPDDPGVILKVNYFRDPVVAGYGVGARAMLFGYFVRLDYAWGIETREVQDPLFYLSIGTDF